MNFKICQPRRLAIFALAMLLSLTAVQPARMPLDEELEVIEPRADDNNNYRLPLTIKPTHYTLHLKPYLLESDANKRFTFDGEAIISITPSENVQQIVMHSKNLMYTKRAYKAEDETSWKDLTNFDLNPVTDIITYQLTDALVKDKKYTLHFMYNGTMDDDMHGFYRSQYVDSANNTKWLASTQFQTNHARRAFPSFDEPKFKATFDVTIRRHKSMNTTSNTKLASSTADGDYFNDVYTRTPIMSTYILAFLVSEFTSRHDGDFGVIARPEYYDQSEYSFEVGKKLLDALGSYLGWNYYELGNDKMDMAAIPDFSAGAMENWGLLTYRERNLLYEENSTTLSAQQSIAAVITHEQAHMWFGDLVTCDWWSYTWLNEGFARYFQYFGTHMVESHFQMDLQFVVAQLQSVMGLDSTNSTNPMSDENTNTPADLSRMFNTISYNKGAVVIRMVRHILGETNFQKSIQEYLKEYAYTNTVPDNLFQYWKTYWPANYANDADGFLKGYTEQVGYPVVHVKVSEDDKNVTFSQERFLLKKGDGSDGSLIYHVPITYTTDNEKAFTDTTPKLFLGNNSVEVKLAKNFTWIIANIQETGFYRVNYEEKLWHRLHHNLFADNWDGIHELNRAQIVDDLLNLARANYISYDLALQVLEYLETETHHAPWSAAFNGFNFLAIRLGTNKDNFGIYINQLAEKAYKQLGFDESANDTSLDIYARTSILTWSCKYGNNDCTSKAKKLFDDLEKTPVPKNIRAVVYCSALRHGAKADYEKLVAKFLKETVATEETLILSSLGCVKDDQLVKDHFEFIISDAVRRQDKSSALTSLYTENAENVHPVFKLVTENYEQLATAMGGYSSVASTISGIASRFTEESQKRELEQFINDHGDKFGSSKATLETAVKTCEENLAWDKERLSTFVSYLDKRVKGGAASMTAFTALSLLLFTFFAKILL